MSCPLSSTNNCSECEWWCAGEKECAVKVIALQLIKLEEKNERH